MWRHQPAGEGTVSTWMCARRECHGESVLGSLQASRRLCS